MDLLRVCVLSSSMSVYCILVVTCWERADHLAFLCFLLLLSLSHLGTGVVLDCIDLLFIAFSLTLLKLKHLF